ncbi:MAG TPA: hypothetical protein VHW01_23270, partial [Polyangiaceae bacterium]|nr:hypothetical protein [Polyangiaceae bacterium]
MSKLRRLAALLVLCAACDDHKSTSQRDAGPTEPSPNASILPAPLASGIETTGAGKADEADAGRHEAPRAISDAGSDAAVPAEPHA